jgi:hypothetical protein
MLPQDLKLEIDRLTREEAMKAARFLASVVRRMRAKWIPRHAGNGAQKWIATGRSGWTRHRGYGRALLDWSPATKQPISSIAVAMH